MNSSRLTLYYEETIHVRQPWVFNELTAVFNNRLGSPFRSYHCNGDGPGRRSYVLRQVNLVSSHLADAHSCYYWSVVVPALGEEKKSRASHVRPGKPLKSLTGARAAPWLL